MLKVPLLRAQVDPALSVRVLGTRELRYSVQARLGDDRPLHVRAASGLAFTQGRLAVIQDDVAFIATVAAGEVAAITLPRGADGRRRFEVEIGNKHEKLDLEACVSIGEDLFAFGSGSTPMRERVVHVGYATRVLDAAPLYRHLRDEIGGAINIEGVALVCTDSDVDEPQDAGHSGALQLWPGVDDPVDGARELWLFHRGNTGPDDRGPTIVRFARVPLVRWLLGNGPMPQPLGSTRVDLGSVDGVRLGFTDAVAIGDRVFYIAAAEDSPNAVDDGRVLGSQIGVIRGDVVRATPLTAGGAPLKAEGLAFQPGETRRAFVAIDPDDIATPAQLYEVELVGDW